MNEKIFVTDFDGTITRYDFYRLAIQQLIPSDCPDFWKDYRQGKITHFDALNAYFKTIRAPESRVLKILDEMQIDPNLAESVSRLSDHGWRVIVTSAGCEWYIEKLLGRAGVDLEVHSNPGTYSSTSGLTMQSPTDSHYYSKNLGIDKAMVVRESLQRGAIVAFAGDGFPDADAAKLVDDKLRFARSDLAEALTDEGLSFQPFEYWSEVAQRLLTV